MAEVLVNPLGRFVTNTFRTHVWTFPRNNGPTVCETS